MNLFINGFLGYFFYKYAWQNPDGAETCFASPVGSEVYSTYEEGTMNMTHMFHLWFVIGFVISMLGIVHALLNLVVPQQMRSISGPVTALGFLGLSTGLGLIVWGSVIRWNNQGKACSGDLYLGNEFPRPEPYLWDSGHFMYLYLVITISLLSCCCGCICCFTCCIGCAAANS